MTSGGHMARSGGALRAYARVFILALYAPMLLIPLFSFNESIYITFPIKAYTLQWYRELSQTDAMWAALWNSIRVGGTCALVSTALGVFAAKAITRYRFRGKGPALGFMMLPLVVPGIILAIAILILLNRIGIPLSLYTVGIGHLVICTPFAIATLIPRYEGFDPALEEASADLGENGWWTFWRVTMPMVLPGVFASLMLTFTISFDEFIMAFFLTGTESTLPMYIWSQLRFPQNLPSVLALSTIIILVSFVMIFLSLWISKLGLQNGRGKGVDA